MRIRAGLVPGLILALGVSKAADADSEMYRCPFPITPEIREEVSSLVLDVVYIPWEDKEDVCGKHLGSLRGCIVPQKKYLNIFSIIYIVDDLSDRQKANVLAHEQCHIMEFIRDGSWERTAAHVGWGLRASTFD